MKSGRFAYIELDVRRSRSDDSATQTPIVIHDETLDRLYKQYNIPLSKRHREGQPISQLTIDIIRGEEIELATLAEAMRAAGGHPVNLELKHADAIESTLGVVNDMISKYDHWTPEKIVFSSMDWSILREIRERDSRFGVALLYSWRHLPRVFGRISHELDVRWIGFNKWLTPFVAPLAKLFNIPQRYAYSVNSETGVKLLGMLGVNGVFTDRQTLPDVVK